MFSVILATTNTHTEKNQFLSAKWTLISETPQESDDQLAIVRLGDATVLLGTDSPEFLPAESRNHKGAGIDMYIELEKEGEIEEVHANHLKAGLTGEKFTRMPWGVRAFHARICGYSFLIAGK